MVSQDEVPGDFRNVEKLTCRSLQLMTSRRAQIPLRPPAALKDIIERALTGDADSVSLEWVAEGLEVTWEVGNTGLGTVISKKDGNRITRFIVRAAGLERRSRGVLGIEVDGKRREISVESYEHFGDWAYRLSFVSPRNKKRPST